MNSYLDTALITPSYIEMFHSFSVWMILTNW